jgi:hypothetical protein
MQLKRRARNADRDDLVQIMAVDETRDRPRSVEFFGVKLTVNNPHLAALLNSTMSDDAQVIGRRALCSWATVVRPMRTFTAGRRAPTAAACA